MRIGLLNNLRAGRSRVQVARLLKCLERYPDIMHVETSHAAAVPEALGEFARQGVDLLVVNGGDGKVGDGIGFNTLARRGVSLRESASHIRSPSFQVIFVS